MSFHECELYLIFDSEFLEYSVICWKAISESSSQNSSKSLIDFYKRKKYIYITMTQGFIIHVLK
jgi:hypothetical protein